MEANESSSLKSKEKFHWGTRHTFVLLSFCGYACQYAMRANLSVAIVAMVESADHQNDSNIGTECPPSKKANQTIHVSKRTH